MGVDNPRDLRRFLFSEYYVLNTLILSTYILFRAKHQDETLHTTIPIPNISQFFFKDAPTADIFSFFKATGGKEGTLYTTWEWQVFATLAATASWRIYRAAYSTDGMLATILTYARIFVLGMALTCDGSALTIYFIAFFMVFLLFGQPVYNGNWTSEVEILTPITFKERTQTAPEPGVATLVFLHAEWSANCRQSYSTFAEVAHKYASSKTCFCQMDVGTFTQSAKALGIDLSPGSSSLPSVILYEQGEEVRRLPGKNACSVAGRKSTGLRMLDMVYGFELDMRLACAAPRSSMASMVKSPPASPAKGTSTAPAATGLDPVAEDDDVVE